jgi:hypothetical protein
LHASLKVDEVLQALVDVATDLVRVNKTAVMVWDDAHERLLRGQVAASARTHYGEWCTGLATG